MTESSESKIARAEIRVAVEKLVRVATKNHAAVVGFVFGADPPLLVRYGNITERGPALAALYLQLSDFAEEKEMSGEVVEDRIKPDA